MRRRKRRRAHRVLSALVTNLMSKKIEISDTDREEIGRLIKEGNTSGILDVEKDGKRPAYRICWSLLVEAFTV